MCPANPRTPARCLHHLPLPPFPMGTYGGLPPLTHQPWLSHSSAHIHACSSLHVWWVHAGIHTAFCLHTYTHPLAVHTHTRAHMQPSVSALLKQLLWRTEREGVTRKSLSDCTNSKCAGIRLPLWHPAVEWHLRLLKSRTANTRGVCFPPTTTHLPLLGLHGRGSLPGLCCKGCACDDRSGASAGTWLDPKA